jgi:hypothetical protein
MTLKGVIFEDFVNYKKPCMVLEFPKCNFKCDKESSTQVCQNCSLVKEPDIQVESSHLVDLYVNNPITEAVCFQGLEPFDSYLEILEFIYELRQHSQDDVVIYTGYTWDEIHEQVEFLRGYKNIVVKFGRYKPGQESHMDDVLGVKLASDNQYAIRL